MLKVSMLSLCSRSNRCVAFAIAALGLPSLASAALLNGSFSSSAPANENLTTDGTIDWGIWDYQSSGAGTSGAPSDRKLGSLFIGNASALLGTPRGITGTSAPPTYTFTDGTSPVSGTGISIGALTDTSINTLGSGFKLNITGNPLLTETVRVYLDSFAAVGTMTATLNGATTYTDSSGSAPASSRLPFVYTFTFQPNSVSDQLQLSYSISTLNGGSANVDLQAVTVAPEPASMGLAGVAGLLLLARRRRAAI